MIPVLITELRQEVEGDERMPKIVEALMKEAPFAGPSWRNIAESNEFKALALEGNNWFHNGRSEKHFAAMAESYVSLFQRHASNKSFLKHCDEAMAFGILRLSPQQSDERLVLETCSEWIKGIMHPPIPDDHWLLPKQEEHGPCRRKLQVRARYAVHHSPFFRQYFGERCSMRPTRLGLTFPSSRIPHLHHAEEREETKKSIDRTLRRLSKKSPPLPPIDSVLSDARAVCRETRKDHATQRIRTRKADRAYNRQRVDLARQIDVDQSAVLHSDTLREYALALCYAAKKKR